MAIWARIWEHTLIATRRAKHQGRSVPGLLVIFLGVKFRNVALDCSCRGNWSPKFLLLRG
jgi:hypothetical protein